MKQHQPRFWSIAHQLRYGLVTSVVASVLITGGLLSYLSFQQQVAQIKASQQNRAQLAATKITAYLEKLQRQLTYVSELQGLTEFSPDVQRSILEGLVSSNSSFEIIAILDAKGRPLQALSPYESISFSSLDLLQAASDSPLFLQTFSRGEDYISRVTVDPQTKLKVINFAVPLRDGQDRVTGVLFAKINLNFVDRIVNTTEVGQTGYTYVLDNQASLIALKQSKLDNQQFSALKGSPFIKELQNLALSNIQSAITYQGLKNEEVIGTARILSRLRWLVVVELPTKEAYATLQWMIVLLGGSTLVGIVLAGSWGILFARSITEPLDRLVNAANELSNNKFDSRVDIIANNELGGLAQSFNHMAVQLQESFAFLEQRVAERTADLAAAQAELQGVFAAMTELIFIYDSQGTHLKIVSSNPGILFNSQDERIGKTLHEIFEPEIADPFLSYIHQALATKKPVNVEYRLNINDQVVWSSATISPISEDQVVWVARDITASKQAEEEIQAKNVEMQGLVEMLNQVVAELQINNAEMQALFTAINDVILVRDAHGKCVKVATPNALGLLGRAEDILGKSLDTTFESETAEHLLALIQQSLATQQTVNAEYSLEVQEQIRWFDASISPINQDLVIWIARDITDRKQVEEELRTKNAEMQALFAAMDDLILIRNAQGMCTKVVTPNATDLIVEAEYVLGEYLHDVFPAHQAEEFLEAIQQAIATKSTTNIEYSLYPGDKEIWFDTRISAIDDKSVIWVARNVTERKKIEAALAVSEAELRAIFAAITDVVIIRDRQGKCLKVAPTNPLNLVSPPEAMLGKTLQETFPPSQAELLFSCIQKALNTGELVNCEYSLTTADQREIWLSANISSISDRAVILVARDITASKQAEENLRRAEQKYRSIFENAIEGIFVSTIEGQYISVNPALVRIYGYESESELINSIKDIAHQLYVDPNRRSEFLATLAENGEVSNFESQIYRADGNAIWISENARTVYDDLGGIPCFEGTVQDITARKTAEVALLRAKEEAEIANKAKSTFIANMSHELRSPLNAILGFAQVLLRSNELSPDHREDVSIIIRSGEHLLSLINQVLDLSKIEAGKVTLNEHDFDLYKLLDDLEDIFSLRTENKGLQLLFEREPSVPQHIHTDETKLRQVMINLLSNALKFTEEGGISVRVKAKPLTNINSEHYIIHFEVQDTGAGIAEEEIDELFEAFVQAQAGKETQEGTGLGLSISRKFVQLMGGDITVQSRLGEGSIFKFSITVNRVAAVETATKQRTRRVLALEPNQVQYRILVVDDRPTNRQLLVKLLTPLGFYVRQAANGQEAVDIWNEWEPHLIWMDMRMPVMDGYEATRRIKSTTKGQATVIVALTASVFEEERAIVLSAGCDDFMRKPFRENEIFVVMAQHLGVRYIYDEQDKLDEEANRLNSNDAREGNLFASVALELLLELKQALLHVDMTELDVLISKIAVVDSYLADVLRKHIDNFEYEYLLDAIAQQEDHRLSS